MLDLARIKHELRAADPAPLHRRFQLAVQAQLLDGTLAPDDTILPERLLHEELRISRSTIRHALRNLIAAGMLRSVRGAGTFVVERRPTRRDRDLVGVIAPDGDFYLYYADLATSLGAGLRAAGLRVDMSIHDNRPDTLADIVGSLLEQHVAAVVLTVRTGPRVEELVEQLRAQGVIVILLSRYLDHSRNLDYIGADNELIGYEATRHLIQLGHAGIVHFAGTDSSTGHDRAFGYVRAMHAAKLVPTLIASWRSCPGAQGTRGLRARRRRGSGLAARHASRSHRRILLQRRTRQLGAEGDSHPESHDPARPLTRRRGQHAVHRLLRRAAHDVWLTRRGDWSPGSEPGDPGASTATPPPRNGSWYQLSSSNAVRRRCHVNQRMSANP